jgi:hypothetical protein
VKVEDTIRGFKEIVEGKHDDIPERAFYMKGTIDEVLEAARGESGDDSDDSGDEGSEDEAENGGGDSEESGNGNGEDDSSEEDSE